MAPPNNPNVAKVALVGHRDTREWVNTFHVAKGSPIVVGDLQPIAEIFKTWWSGVYRLAFPPTVVLDQIQVRKLDPADPLALDYTTGLPEAGTYVVGAGESIEPGNVSLALSMRTGFAGRKYRGRFYVPSVMEGQRGNDDRVTSPWVTTYVSIVQQLLSAFLTTIYLPAIFHRATNTWTAITSFVIDGILDSMRRRLPGRGR